MDGAYMRCLGNGQEVQIKPKVVIPWCTSRTSSKFFKNATFTLLFVAYIEYLITLHFQLVGGAYMLFGHGLLTVRRYMMVLRMVRMESDVIVTAEMGGAW